MYIKIFRRKQLAREQKQQPHQQQQQHQRQRTRQQQQQQPQNIQFILSEMATIIILTVAIQTETDTEAPKTRDTATTKITNTCSQNAGGVLGRRLKRLTGQMKRRNGLADGINPKNQRHLPLEQYMKSKVLYELYGF